MKGSRWVVVAAAMAVVVLVSPAIGAGRGVSGPLAWSRGGIAVRSYDFTTLASGSRASRNFRLTNVGQNASGRFAVRLTGSSAFSIGSTGCTGKSLDVRKWCRVTVVYAPIQPGASDRAVLTAAGAHGTATRLNLSGCSADGSVYWAETDNGSVNEGLLAKGCPTTITTLARPDEPSALAVDGTHVYFTTWSGTVNAVPRGGGKVTTLATGQHYPESLAVDGTYVYWAERGNTRGTGTVNKVPIGGGAVTTLATGQDAPISVAVDGTHVYWATPGTYPDFNGMVNAVPVGGGPVTTLATGQPGAGSLAVDGTHVYWANDYGDVGTVNAVPVGGGPVITLASRQHVSSMAVDGTHVYWSNWSGTVNSVPVGGGAVSSLASGLYYPNSVVVDSRHVYWADSGGGGSVNEVPLGGGNVTNLVHRQGDLVALVVGPQ